MTNVQRILHCFLVFILPMTTASGLPSVSRRTLVKTMRSMAALFTIVISLSIHNFSYAAPFLPGGLKPGDVYHLVFVTSGFQNARGSEIETYNAFVQAQATNNPSLTGTDMGVAYFVIGSTRSVSADFNARDNALVSAPVYNLIGELIATGFGDMWDGSIQNPIRYNEFGVPQSAAVWTGSNADGLAASNALGDRSGPVTLGLPYVSTSGWISGSGSPNEHITRNFYALSEQLIVPGVVPEPNALALALLGGIGVFLSRHRTATQKEKRSYNTF